MDEAEEELPAGAVGRLRLVHPAGAGDEGWNLVTEELGYLEDGAVYPVASTNGVLRRPGATVLAEEVAETLRRQPGVTDAAVFGIPDDERAEQIGAAVVTRYPWRPESSRMRFDAAWALPRAPTSSSSSRRFPRNERGVLLHRRLRERMGLPVERVDHVAASTPVEETIVAMWERVLDRDGVGVHDDYFELGGDQMGACRMLDLMADAFGVAPSLSTFLASPTVAALAASAELDTDAEGDPQVAPVAFSQEGMVWHEQLAPGSQSLPPWFVVTTAHLTSGAGAGPGRDRAPPRAAAYDLRASPGTPGPGGCTPWGVPPGYQRSEQSPCFRPGRRAGQGALGGCPSLPPGGRPALRGHPGPLGCRGSRGRLQGAPQRLRRLVRQRVSSRALLSLSSLSGGRALTAGRSPGWLRRSLPGAAATTGRSEGNGRVVVVAA